MSTEKTVHVNTPEEAVKVVRDWQLKTGGRVGVSGPLVFRDKDKNIVKTMELNGSVPLQPPKE